MTMVCQIIRSLARHLPLANSNDTASCIPHEMLWILQSWELVLPLLCLQVPAVADTSVTCLGANP